MIPTATDGKQIVLSLGSVPALVVERIAPLAAVVELPSAQLSEYRGSPEDVVALVVRGHAPIDASMIARLPSLRVIARTGVGVDLVDVEAATARGIPVAITANAGTRAVAEGAFAMILHLVKRLGPSPNWSARTVGRSANLPRRVTWTERFSVSSASVASGRVLERSAGQWGWRYWRMTPISIQARRAARR